MKKNVTLIFLGIILVFSSCSNNTNNNNNCPTPITSSIGNYASYLSGISTFSITNTNPVNIQVLNSTSCDFIELKLTGAITTSLKAKFNSTIPSQGNYFIISSGQSIQFNGTTFNVNGSSKSVFINDGDINFGLTATSSNTDFLNISIRAQKI